MPIWVAAIGIAFTLVMVLLLLREVRENRARLRDKDRTPGSPPRIGEDGHSGG